LKVAEVGLRSAESVRAGCQREEGEPVIDLDWRLLAGRAGKGKRKRWLKRKRRQRSRRQSPSCLDHRLPSHHAHGGHHHLGHHHHDLLLHHLESPETGDSGGQAASNPPELAVQNTPGFARDHRQTCRPCP